jgi:hypothetical protein
MSLIFIKKITKKSLGELVFELLSKKLKVGFLSGRQKNSYQI